MWHIKLSTCKTILASKYWLIITLCGAFFSFFAINRGGIVVFIDISACFLLINIIIGDYNIKNIPTRYWVISAACVWLLVVSIIVSPQESHSRWMANVPRMLCIMFSIHYLTQKKLNHRILALFPVILSLTVCSHFAAYYIWKMPYGNFTNIHYLATLTALSLPMFVYYFFNTTRWYKFVYIPIAIMAGELLLQTCSRPAIIGIIVGTLFVLLFLTSGRFRWAGILSMFLILSGLYFTQYAHVAPSLEELIVNLPKEERVFLWGQALNKINDNSFSNWLFGHGIGWFPVTYDIDKASSAKLIFPHLHLLEITYLNGITGLIIIFGGLLSVLFFMWKQIKQSSFENHVILLKYLFVILITWLIHSGITLPFYSRYSIYPLSFILGIIFVLIGEKQTDLNIKR